MMPTPKKVFVSAVTIALSSVAVLNCLTLSAQQTITAKSGTEEGVKTTVFQTPNGTLTVNVPDDMSASDTISGTVVAEPAGNTEEEKKENEDTLSGYVIDVKPQSAPPIKPVNASTPDFSCVIPEVCSAILITLSDAKHKPLSENNMACLPKPPVSATPTDQVILPTKGTCGKPVKVKGKCDGEFTNSSILIGGKKCRMLAESPRQQVCLTPVDVVGTTNIECIEGTRHVTGTFQNNPPAQHYETVKQPPTINLNGGWNMTGSAEGHSSTMPVTVSQQGNSVSWQLMDTTYTGTLSGNTIQFTMSGSYWHGDGTLTVDPSGNTLTGACNYVYNSGRAAPATMTIQMTR